MVEKKLKARLESAAPENVEAHARVGAEQWRHRAIEQ